MLDSEIFITTHFILEEFRPNFLKLVYYQKNAFIKEVKKFPEQRLLGRITKLNEQDWLCKSQRGGGGFNVGSQV